MEAGKAIPVFGDGTMARDYTYIADIVDGVEASTRREFGFEIINLGESRAVTLNEMIRLLEAAMGGTALINRQPGQPGDVPVTCACLEKARALLGYEPKVAIEEGLGRFVSWFREASGD
jgi:UDP-glucuronate 4-epimerase